MLKEVHPVLPSKNVTEAITFYVEKLGFELKFQDGDDPNYAGVRRDGVEIHLQWHDPQEWSRVERPMLRFLVPSCNELYQEYIDRGIFHDWTAIRDTPWGTREFSFYDPDGNGLTFYRDL